MTKIKNIEIKNNWTSLSVAYNAARRGYMPEVYAYLKSLMKTEGRAALDLGCGTGISTRELKEAGLDVIGADRDSSMIQVASQVDPTIKYLQASADDLPFENDQFDVVTAFTAFHWFENESSVNSVKRVLKPGGLFFAALKKGRDHPRTDTLDKAYDALLKKYAGREYSSITKYAPRDLLERCGFKNTREKSFSKDEFYSVDDALTLLKSSSFWNLVSEADRSKLFAEVRSLLEQNLVEGQVLRARSIVTIAAYK